MKSGRSKRLRGSSFLTPLSASRCPSPLRLSLASQKKSGSVVTSAQSLQAFLQRGSTFKSISSQRNLSKSNFFCCFVLKVRFDAGSYRATFYLYQRGFGLWHVATSLLQTIRQMAFSGTITNKFSSSELPCSHRGTQPQPINNQTPLRKPYTMGVFKHARFVSGGGGGVRSDDPCPGGLGRPANQVTTKAPGGARSHDSLES